MMEEKFNLLSPAHLYCICYGLSMYIIYIDISLQYFDTHLPKWPAHLLIITPTHECSSLTEHKSQLQVELNTHDDLMHDFTALA